jgi:hypothetical protein
LAHHTVTTLAARGCRLLLATLFFHTGADAATSFTQDLAPTRLRGYGELSAKFTSAHSTQGGALSTLVITCESEAKAGSVLAKFVSDLHLLGEIRDDTLAVGDVKAPVFVVARQGALAAFRNGKVVTILASPTAEGLSTGLMSLKTKLAGAELTPRSTIPMYLDSWDKHGFRFYYWPFQHPHPPDAARSNLRSSAGLAQSPARVVARHHTASTETAALSRRPNPRPDGGVTNPAAGRERSGRSIRPGRSRRG